jgi:hypothetical protein
MSRDHEQNCLDIILISKSFTSNTPTLIDASKGVLPVWQTEKVNHRKLAKMLTI